MVKTRKRSKRQIQNPVVVYHAGHLTVANAAWQQLRVDVSSEMREETRSIGDHYLHRHFLDILKTTTLYCPFNTIQTQKPVARLMLLTVAGN